MWTVFTFRKTISNFLDKLLEKMLTLFAFSLKILKILIISITIMWVRICQRKSLENFVTSAGKKPHGFAVINLTSKKDAGKYRGGFDNFFIS